MRQAKSPIVGAYQVMAEILHYRPAAPSDGFGNITRPLEELDLDAEARHYAARWDEQESTGEFLIGCTDYSLAPATVFVIEAARLLCSGPWSGPWARKLLEMALDEIEYICHDVPDPFDSGDDGDAA
jgi:hypothetical protein